MTASWHGGPRDGTSRQGDGADLDCPTLLSALLDGMDAALCALDTRGIVTHWNREAERVLGWSREEAVGRAGFAGWAVREADADEVTDRLLGTTEAEGRQVHEFALLTKDGRRVLVRAQSAAVPGPDGRSAGVYCAFSEVHVQADLERSLALSESLLTDAAWGVVLVDADLRPTAVNPHAARALGPGRTSVLGRPLGDLLAHGAEEIEGALAHVLAEGDTRAGADIWVSVPGQGEQRRRCWRSGFVRLASPLSQEPVPLGVGWMFQDVTEARETEQAAARLRFRNHQLHRAGLAAAECADPAEGAVVHLDFALPGFADHAVLDVFERPPAGPPRPPASRVRATDAPGAPPYPSTGGARPVESAPGHGEAGPRNGHIGTPVGSGGTDSPRLVRAAAAPGGAAGTDVLGSGTGLPVRYGPGHPALLCTERTGAVTENSPASPATGDDLRAAAARRWARDRHWPEDTAYALCVALRSRARTVGVLTFLRTGDRSAFAREDVMYAESIAVRTAGAVDLGLASRRDED